jgi:hypothetical protein
MAANTTSDWVSYYRNNHGDKGTIEALYALGDDELADIAKGHNNNVGALRTTIACSGGGNFLLVPGSKGIVKFLHQGFSSTTHLGGPTILGFIQGNFTSSPFKAISNPAEAVLPIDQGRVTTRGKESAPTACPKLASIFGAKSEEEFVALTGEVDTLADRPNHLFIHPRIFTRADGPRTIQAKSLAFALIKQFNQDLTNASSDQEKAEIGDERDNAEVLLAFLWASEQGLLTGVTLSDVPESPHLNHQCELIVQKIRKTTAPQSGTALDPAGGLAIATQSLMLSMQKTESTRIQERAEDKSAKSLIRNLTPRQQGLFTKLCTDHMHTAPVVPTFLTACLAEKAPHRATNLITAETRKWKGTFSAAGLSRFLAGGYLSQEGPQGEPGGFTVFMFHPRSPLSKGSSTESNIKSRSRVREFFELEADSETVKFYQKKEFFVPTTENELKIVLQTWHDLLILLTVENSIAVEGLALILEKFDDHYQVLQEMFTSIDDFGLTVLVILDNQLQKFFEMVTDMDDVKKASSRQRDFLWRHATEFLEDLENRKPPSVVIPQCLRRTPTVYDEDKESTPKKRKAPEDSEEKARKTASKKVVNKEPQHAWSIPEGKTYQDFFSENSPHKMGWPKLVDPRAEGPRQMCVSFQVKGHCTKKCTRAHVSRSKLSSKQETDITSRFKSIYGK